MFDTILSNRPEKMRGETIKIGDHLPDHYAKTLDSLTDVVPPRFLEQARTTAYYMYSLDEKLNLLGVSGAVLNVHVDKFAREMADLPSVKMVYAISQIAERQAKSNTPPGSRRVFNNSIPLEKCLPRWVDALQKSDKPETKQEGIPEAAKSYLQYTSSGKVKKKYINSAEYHYYDPSICPPQGSSPVDIFKGYIENDVQGPQMTALFKDLAELKIHPSSSKLFEDERIVLYWDTCLSDKLSNKLQQTFNKHHVQYRGFGQDSMQVKIDEDGSWKFEVRSSNDRSRGEGGGGVDFSENKYTPERFFQLYLQQMMKHCRNPLDPYRMSFVPVIGSNDILMDSDQLQHQLEQIKNRGLDVPWYAHSVPILF